MSENCYRRVRDWAKDQGYDLPDGIVRDMGLLLERMQAKEENFGPVQFQTAVDELLGQWGERMSSKYKAAEKQALAKRMAAAEAVRTGPYEARKNFEHVVLGGSIKTLEGGNIAPSAMKKAYLGKYTSMLRNMLADEDMRVLQTEGLLTREIFQELDAIQKKAPAGQSGSKQAARIAQAIDTLNAATFRDKKMVNPFMEKTEDFFGHRVWNRDRVAMVSKEDFVRDVFDNAKDSFPDMDTAEKVAVLEKMYDDIKSGRSQSFSLPKDTGFGKLRKMAAGRKILANNWEAEHFLFSKYGYPTLGESLATSMQGAARDVTVFSKWTHDPETFLKRLAYDVFESRAEAEAALDWAKDSVRAFTVPNTPSNNLGKIGSALLSLEAVEHLGTAAVSSWADLPVAAAMLKSINGDSIMTNFVGSVANYAALASQAGVREEVMRTIGLATKMGLSQMHETLGFGHSAVSLDDIKTMATSGKLVDAFYQGTGKLSEAYGHLNLLSTHVDAASAAVGYGLAEGLGKISAHDAGLLAPELKNQLKRAGLGGAEWNLMRGAAKEVEIPGFGKTTLLIPSEIEKLPDAKVVTYIEERGLGLTDKKTGEPIPPTPDELNFYRQEIAGKYATMINDFASVGSSTPGSWEHNLLYGKSDINTWWGLSRRALFQFKSAAVTNFRNISRLAYQGANPLKADLAGVGQFAGLALGMGMMINWTKDALHGKTPQDPRDPNFVARAFASSGIGGLYADILTSELMATNPLMGQASTYSRLAGPLLGDTVEAGSIAAGYARAGATDLSGGWGAKYPSKQLSKYAMGKVPNIVFFKDALNFYFLNGIQSAADPAFTFKQAMRTSENRGLFAPQQGYFMMNPTDSVR